ncbi:MAG: hypothetical protein WB797_18750, partial [Nocardioides sp.]
YNTAMTTFMSVGLPTTATIHSAIGDSRLPAGLTDADAERIAAAIAAARTETTRHVYALIWAQWDRWCASRGTPALPGDPFGPVRLPD